MRVGRGGLNGAPEAARVMLEVSRHASVPKQTLPYAGVLFRSCRPSVSVSATFIKQRLRVVSTILKKKTGDIAVAVLVCLWAGMLLIFSKVGPRAEAAQRHTRRKVNHVIFDLFSGS